MWSVIAWCVCVCVSSSHSFFLGYEILSHFDSGTKDGGIQWFWHLSMRNQLFWFPNGTKKSSKFETKNGMDFTLKLPYLIYLTIKQSLNL